MKKIFYLMGLMLVAGSLVFTSCSDDDDTEPVDLSPVVNFIGGAGYTDGDATLFVGEMFKVGISARENSTSDKKLESFKITRTYNNVPTTVFDTTFSLESLDWDINLSANMEVGEERWAFIVTDKDGESTELAFIITTEAATTPLGDAEAFTWQRIAANPGTGLDMFGLKWTSNLREVMAQIKKDGASKFVELDAATWTSLTTVEDLAAAIEAGTDMDVYAGISAEVNQTYDVVLATMFNEEYFLIHITEGDIFVDPVQGTTITITGDYKK